MAITRTQQAKQLLNKVAPKGEKLAYINDKEAKLLKKMGGAGIDVNGTGIKSYVDFGGGGSGYGSAQDTFDSAEASRLLENVRTHRNNLLAQTDWWAFPDSPEMTDSQTKYRQDLRDITKQDDLNNITWPTKPE